MEFKMRYPDNRHVTKANIKIEQVELKRYEKMDTIEGYREFLSKYYESPFSILAKERLQELEFRELDSTLQQKYRFDLLRPVWTMIITLNRNHHSLHYSFPFFTILYLKTDMQYTFYNCLSLMIWSFMTNQIE